MITNERIEEILKALPKIRKIIKNGGKWKDISAICWPLGLSDTAFRDNPTLNDFLVSRKYWINRLK